MNRHSIATRLRTLAQEQPADITAALLHLAADLEPEYYQGRAAPSAEPVVEQPAPPPEPTQLSLVAEPVETKPEDDESVPRRGLLGIFRRPS